MLIGKRYISSLKIVCMDFEDYQEEQRKAARASTLAEHFKISEDELDQVFEGHIEEDLMNDDVLNGYIVYFVDDAPAEITGKIAGYEANGNYVWVSPGVFATPDDEY